MKNIPSDLQGTDLSSWIARPKDSEAKVVLRLNEAKSLKTELEKVFGIKETPESSGIMQSIPSEGLGEGDGKDYNSSLEKVVEIIESSLLRPVDITYKWDV